MKYSSNHSSSEPRPSGSGEKPQAPLPYGRGSESTLCLALIVLLAGCGKKVSADQELVASMAPPPAQVEPDVDANNFKVDHPEQFPIVKAMEYIAAPELKVTGVVSADTSKQVPVPSLASGKIVEINARVGDEVKKDQLLFKVRSTDIAAAYSDYQKAVKNQQLAVQNASLAKIQHERAALLFEHGTVAKSNLEIAENAELAATTAVENAKVDVETTTEHLHLLGSDPDHPTGIVPVYAPVSGVITDQQVTAGAGVQALNLPAPFTITDLSHVWVICDVYENNLGQVHVGEFADIRLDAYPNRVFKARISTILPTLDPNIRTAKVRLELDNPGFMRIGMFVTATFHGPSAERHASVPADAILHLHDRDWVYVPLGNGRFRRVEVMGGIMLPDRMQEVVSGIKPGDQVVSNALVLQSTVEQ